MQSSLNKTVSQVIFSNISLAVRAAMTIDTLSLPVASFYSFHSLLSLPLLLYSARLHWRWLLMFDWHELTQLAGWLFYSMKY